MYLPSHIFLDQRVHLGKLNGVETEVKLKQLQVELTLAGSCLDMRSSDEGASTIFKEAKG